MGCVGDARKHCRTYMYVCMNTYVYTCVCMYVHVQSIDNSSLTLTRQMFAYRSSSFQLMRSPSSPPIPSPTNERRCDSEYDFALLLLRKKEEKTATLQQKTTHAMRAYACMYICIHMYVYKCTCVYTNSRTYVYFCKCVSLCVRLSVCSTLHARTNTHTAVDFDLTRSVLSLYAHTHANIFTFYSYIHTFVST